MKDILLFTDGSCLGNPGPGGWAAILNLRNTSHRKELFGGFRLTTNNRMEIMAALHGLEALREPCNVLLFSDSRYLCDSINNGWLINWQKRNWIKADKKPVLNVDLWKKLLLLLSRHNVQMEWLRGHNGHQENERCDQLARTCAQKNDLPADVIFEENKGIKN